MAEFIIFITSAIVSLIIGFLLTEKNKKKFAVICCVILFMAAILILVFDNPFTKEDSAKTAFAATTGLPTNALTATSIPATTPTYETTSADWSEWVADLPIWVTPSSYDVEQKTQYKYQELSDDTSNWSEWQSYAPTGTNIIQIEQQYKVCNKVFQDDINPTLTGWAQYGTPVISYGNWSDWSDTPVSSTNTLDVNTQQVTVYKTVYNYSRWKYWRTDTNSWAYSYSEYKGSVYGGSGIWQYKASDSPLQCTGTAGDVAGAPPRYEGLWYNESTSQEANGTKTQYQTRSITTTYHYWKWGTWSDWTTGTYSGFTTDMQIENRYRYKSSSQKLGNWSDWSDVKTETTDTINVETRIVYRYKEK